MTAPTTCCTGVLSSPLGPFYIEACTEGLIRCGWVDTGLEDHDTLTRSRHVNGGLSEFMIEAQEQFQAYFAGQLQRFDLPLAPRGTAFQQRVWQELLNVPYGMTKSYGDIAHGLGKPTAARAVGAAVGRNPIAIVVPCHRIIGANGALTGFASGLDRKRWLLALETSHEIRH